ncbi:MAG: hypothetical protein A2281_13685 [Bacteroidetes bacterium RIFOXYA12_FULL_38_20]|nr:MAG: hypothetical protein A2281_13685 [Bacteroidetes bacterium RIFOXYA12_FULL_38_20]
MKKSFKFLMIVAFLTFLSVASFGQEEKEKLVKPEPIGEAQIDGWVDKCFELYDTTCKADEDIKVVDEMLKSFEADANNITEGKKASLKNNLEIMTKRTGECQAQVINLAGKTEEMTTTAKNITPKTKMPKAIKSVNTGAKALNETKSNLARQAKAIAEQSEKAKNYL